MWLGVCVCVQGVVGGSECIGYVLTCNIPFLSGWHTCLIKSTGKKDGVRGKNETLRRNFFFNYLITANINSPGTASEPISNNNFMWRGNVCILNGVKNTQRSKSLTLFSYAFLIVLVLHFKITQHWQKKPFHELVKKNTKPNWKQQQKQWGRFWKERKPL